MICRLLEPVPCIDDSAVAHTISPSSELDVCHQLEHPARPAPEFEAVLGCEAPREGTHVAVVPPCTPYRLCYSIVRLFARKFGPLDVDANKNRNSRAHSPRTRRRRRTGHTRRLDRQHQRSDWTITWRSHRRDEAIHHPGLNRQHTRPTWRVLAYRNTPT